MKKGFTLVELVIVIVILGILAAVALPKFIDITGEAKISATKAGLGAIRSVIALKYSKNLAEGTTPAYPTALYTTDFFDGKYPINKITGKYTIEAVFPAVTNGLATSDGYGWWFASTGDSAGQAGAYSDGHFDTITTW